MPQSDSYPGNFSPNDKQSAKTIVQTTAAVLPDGTMLDVVLDSESNGELSLVCWNGKEAIVGKRFEQNERVYVPPRLHTAALHALRLPTEVVPYGSTRQLFDDILAVLTGCMGLVDKVARQLVYTIFASWVIERLCVAPLVSVIAPLGSPRAEFLAFLSCFYRRSLILPEANLSILSCLPSDFRPTCLFDEPELSRRVARLLYASRNRGAVIARNGRIVDVSSAKVVCTREPLRDSLLASQALEISLSPDCSLPAIDLADTGRIAAECQPKLLMYRLMNYSRAGEAQIDVAGLSGPVRDVARSLASSVVGDDGLQRGIVDVLRERDDEIRILRSMEPDAAVIEALLFCVHQAERQTVICGELADIVNELGDKRGEGQRITPESVGWNLKNLQLRREPIGSKGRGLKFTNAVRARVHELARVHGVLQAAKKGCPYCNVSAEVGAVQADNGTHTAGSKRAME